MGFDCGFQQDIRNILIIKFKPTMLYIYGWVGLWVSMGHHINVLIILKFFCLQNYVCMYTT